MHSRCGRDRSRQARADLAAPALAAARLVPLGVERWVSPLLIWCFSAWEARNTSTRRGLIGTSVPVFGLRPTRCPFWRTAKLPNDEILTFSPSAAAPELSAFTDPTSPPAPCGASPPPG